HNWVGSLTRHAAIANRQLRPNPIRYPSWVRLGLWVRGRSIRVQIPEPPNAKRPDAWTGDSTDFTSAETSPDTSRRLGKMLQSIARFLPDHQSVVATVGHCGEDVVDEAYLKTLVGGYSGGRVDGQSVRRYNALE